MLVARSTAWLPVLALVSAASIPASAAAQDPPAYGGGKLGPDALSRTYHPTVGVVFAPRGGQVAVHVDTTVRCGRDSYQVRAHRLGQPSTGQVTAAGKGRLALGGGRVTWHWSLGADLDGRLAVGVLTVGGKRRLGGHTTSCNRTPQRQFRARAATAPTGATAMPPAGASYLRPSAVRLAGGAAGPPLLRGAARGPQGFPRRAGRAPRPRAGARTAP